MLHALKLVDTFRLAWQLNQSLLMSGDYSFVDLFHFKCILSQDGMHVAQRTTELDMSSSQFT